MSNVKVTNLLHGSSASNNITLASDGTTTIPTVKATTQVLVGGVSSTANGGTLQISNGITFPATQSACSDANTLDDYEEGTWTPSISGSTTAGTTTYGGTRAGRYNKIGRQVTAFCSVVYTATTGTGLLQIEGFPFAFPASDQYGQFCALEVSQFNWTGGTYLVVAPEAGTSYALIYGEADDAARVAQNITNETAVFQFALTYYI